MSSGDCLCQFFLISAFLSSLEALSASSSPLSSSSKLRRLDTRSGAGRITLLLGSGLACHSSSLHRLVSTAEIAMGLIGGPDVFLKECLVFSLLIDSMSSSTGVDCFLIAANFRSPAGFRGGLDLMKSRITSWASRFTFGGNLPSTITLFSLYLLDLMSSISISYGVSS